MSPSTKMLQVTADAAADITVVDGKLNRVARGMGELRQELPMGIYEVRVRVGPERKEQIVSLNEDRVINFPIEKFPSPVPLDETSRSHEYHQQAAIEASRRPQDGFGTGASILVFARVWTADGRGTEDNPAAGLRFRDWSGKVDVDVASRADVRGPTRMTPDPSAGWCVEVSPGGYRICLSRPDGSEVERAVYAAAGQQTQLFVLDSRYPDQSGKSGNVTGRGLDMEGGTISIAPSGQFNPNNRSARLAELAKYALTQKRGFLSDSLISELLNQKFEDRALGLFGAHLLLREKPDDVGLFKIVTDNLLNVLGADHPDVQALCLRREDRGRIVNLQIRSPPMLRVSWDLVVRESFKDSGILPPDTPSRRIAASILPSSPWLTWDGRPEAATGDNWTGLTNTLSNYVGARSRAAQRKSSKQHTGAQRLRGWAPHLLSSLSAFGLMGPLLETPPSEPEKVDLTAEDKIELAQILGTPSQVLQEKLDKVSELAELLGTPSQGLQEKLDRLS